MIVTGGLAVSLGSCSLLDGDASVDAVTTESTLAAAPTASAAVPPATNVEPASPLAPINGSVGRRGARLEFTEVGVGDGAAASQGDTVLVEFQASSPTTGELVDGTPVGEPLSFRVGGGQVMAGIELGVDGMRVGGQRQLVVPGSMVSPAALGATSGGVSASTSEDLVVDLRLISVVPPQLDAPTAASASALAGDTVDVVVGDGAAAAVGDRVTVNFLAAGPGGDLVYSTWETGRLSALTVGEGAMPVPVEEAIVGMKVGGRRRVVVPAVDDDGLTYLVELIHVAPPT